MVAFSTSLLTSANFKRAESTPVQKKHCRGYTVIEVDKGIDCYGDTIRLVKVNGFFERVAV